MVLPTSTILCRFIPAWAGNADARELAHFDHPVHPRVGGERLCPMGRSIPGVRFIPAWAGNA